MSLPSLGISNESETSLDRALNEFDGYRAQMSMESTHLEPLLRSLKDRRVFTTAKYSKVNHPDSFNHNPEYPFFLSKSICFLLLTPQQDTIISNSDGGSDLWGMRSSRSQSVESIPQKKEEIITTTPNINETQSPSKTKCSAPVRDGPFARFQHIKSTKS